MIPEWPTWSHVTHTTLTEAKRWQEERGDRTATTLNKEWEVTQTQKHMLFAMKTSLHTDTLCLLKLLII